MSIYNPAPFKVGDRVRLVLPEVFKDAHREHGLYQNIGYTVTQLVVRQGRFMGIKLDNLCPNGDDCYCFNGGNYWLCQDFVLCNETITQEEASRAVDLPSPDRVKEFFK